MNEIFKYDFDNINDQLDGGVEFRPAVLVFGESFWHVSSWEECLKIFYHNACETYRGKEYFKSLNNQLLSVRDGTLSCSDAYGSEKIFVGDFGQSPSDYVKFSRSQYVVCHKNGKKRGVTVERNLKIMGCVRSDLNLKGIEVYLVSSDEGNADDVEDVVVSDLSESGKTERDAKKDISGIDSDILTPSEKFYARVDREFDEKVFIGDVEISEEEEKNFLVPYMAHCLDRLTKTGKLSLSREKAFALGLVRFAMKYYGLDKKNFWGYLKVWCGVEVPAILQTEIGVTFRIIMLKYDKAYIDVSRNYIDDINMHCFVTDNFAGQLFDYVLDFWRLDLKCDAGIAFDEDGGGNKYLDALLDEIEANNQKAVSNIMKHTSMAVEANRGYCAEKIGQILRTIDECFWNKAQVPDGGTRIERLLSRWMGEPKGKFRGVLNGTIPTAGGRRGMKLLSKPQLCVKVKDGSISIKFPTEVLRNWEEGDEPVWRVSADGEDAVMYTPELYRGSVGVYTEENELGLPDGFFFKKICIKLYTPGKTFAEYPIKGADTRFFDEKGCFTEWQEGYIPAGTYYAYSKRVGLPTLLNKERQEVIDTGKCFFCQYKAEYGDVLLFPDDGRAVFVGEKIKEGLRGAYPENGIKAAVQKERHAAASEEDLDVYSRLPEVLFRTKDNGLAGVYLDINDGENRVRLSENNCREFKLDDSVEDVFGYIVDLNKFLKKDGIYKVSLHFPGTKAPRDYEFAYLRGLRFEFEGAPYVFKDTGRVAFSIESNVICDGDDWEIAPNGSKILSFNFDPANRDFSGRVRGRDLAVAYRTSDGIVDLRVRIPALFWKYEREGAWNMKRPAELFLRRLPERLYVSGPFDFSDKTKNKLNVSENPNADYLFEETDIYAARVQDENFFSFDLSTARSWVGMSKSELYLYVTLAGDARVFTRVSYLSRVEAVSLSSVPVSGTLCGSARIAGGERYAVTVSLNGARLAENVPIEDGRFELKTDLDSLGGEYALELFEICEDEYGFGEETHFIGKFTLRIADIGGMAGKRLSVKRFAFRGGNFAPYMLSGEYCVQGLRRLDDTEGLEINARWLCDEEYSRAVYYEGTLCHGGEDDFPVMVIFRDPDDAGKVSLLRKFEGEYLEMLYNHVSQELVEDENALGFTRWEIKDRIRTLEDDRLDCIVEIMD